MAVTVTPLLTDIDTAESVTAWVGVNVSPALNNDVFLQGAGSIQFQVSQEVGYVYAGITATNLSNSRIYAWVLPPGSTDTETNGGLRIYLGDGTNNIGYYVGGSDSSLFTQGTWVCLTLDTSNLPSNFTAEEGSEASLDLANITRVGVGVNNPQKATGNSPNAWADVIRYGTGLRVTDGTVGDEATFSQILSASNNTNNYYGIIREIGTGVYGIQGDLIFGSGSTATNSVRFVESNITLIVEDKVFNTVGTNLPIKFLGEHNTTGEFTASFGTAVSSGDDLSGRGGLTIINTNASQSVEFDFSNPNIELFDLYGSTLLNVQGAVSFSGDSTNGPNHNIAGTTFNNCSQVDFGRTFTRNNIFAAHSQSITEGALLWNSNIDIKNTSFLANAVAIEHEQAGTFAYDSLTFSDNTYDILNTSNGAVTASATNGSNPSIAKVFNAGTSTTDVATSNTLTLTNVESGSEIAIVSQSSFRELITGSEQVANPPGTFIYTRPYPGFDQNVDIIVHALDYEYYILPFTLQNQNQSIQISQVLDRNYDNPE
jgi:hypothetical protein